MEVAVGEGVDVGVKVTVGVSDGIGVEVATLVGVLVGVAVALATKSPVWLTPIAIITTTVTMSPSTTPITIFVSCWSGVGNSKNISEINRLLRNHEIQVSFTVSNLYSLLPIQNYWLRHVEQRRLPCPQSQSDDVYCHHLHP